MTSAVVQSIRASLALLPRRDRFLIGVVVLVQVALAALDLLGVLCLGLVAVAATSAVSGQKIGVIVRLQSLTGQQDLNSLALYLAGLAALALIAKSVLSFLVTRRALRFLANRQATISGALVAQLLSQPLLFVQLRSSQETSFALTAGANAATLGILGNAIVIASESGLLVVFTIGLASVDLLVTIFTLVFFGIVAGVLHRLLAERATRLGRRGTRAEIESLSSVQQALRTYREVTVSGRRSLYVNHFRELRWQAAATQADTQIVSQIPKYIFEIALVVGGALLAVSQIATRDTGAAIGIIIVFLAAGSRMMPSLLRLQAAILSTRTAMGSAQPTFELAQALEAANLQGDRAEESSVGMTSKIEQGIMHGYEQFEPSIDLRNVSLRYPNAAAQAICDVSLHAPNGSSLALVGATGAGKSSLADLLLGVISPDSGQVTLGALSPSAVANAFPGSMAYVPQDISVVDGTIRDNVALGLPPSLVLDDLVWEALERAQLAIFLREQREGLDTIVGEHGIRLSGGQRQRLGLARALYTRPRLIVLDEATSALDAETERAVSDTLLELGDDVTLVIIAHRLATIRHCTQVAYLERGKLRSLGTFDQVRQEVPDFDRQAQLLGL